MMKAKFTAILISLLAAFTGLSAAYADGPGQPPYIEPTEEITDAEYTEKPTINPYEELYQRQAEANEQTNGLLADIKSLVTGLKSNTDVTTAPASVPAAVQTVPTSAPTAVPTPEPTEIPKVTETDGNGYIVEDTQQLNGGMEFLTMASKDGTTFYMVIDRNKDNEVYLLNKVDNADLAGFTEETASPEPEASPSPSPTPTVTPITTPERETAAATKKSGTGTSVFIIILALAGGSVVYWFKFRKNSSGGDVGFAEESDSEIFDEEYNELNGNEVNEDEEADKTEE
ncbi:MAG: CD1107 family mobile element protein [Candidatus Ornithomonoglobus sp.]